MKIARLVAELPQKVGGGLSPNVFYVSEWQAKQGHEVEIFALGEKAAKGKCGNCRVFWEKRPRLVRVFGGLALLRAVERTCFETEIVHALNPAPLGWMFELARKKLKAKYCLSIHGAIDFRKGMGGTSGFGNFVDSFEGMILKKFLAKRVDLVLPVNEQIKVELIEAGIAEEKIEVVRSGVDTKLFKPKNVEKNRGKFVVLYAGRFADSKGLGYLIAAMTKLKNENVELRLVGGKNENLSKLIERLGLTGIVKILPKIAYEKMPEVYNGADCFVMPSLYEPFGKAVLEAMACGVPTVFSRNSGLAEVFVDERDCLLVEPGNEGAIVEGILRVMNDSTVRRRIVRNAAEKVKEFDWQKTAKAYTNAFETVLGR